MDKYYIAAGTVTPGTVAHTAADVVGGLLTFDMAAGGAKVSGGRIEWAALADDDNEGAALELYLFDSEPTSIAANAAGTLAAADLRRICGQVSFGTADYVTINSMKACFKRDLQLPFAADKLYGYLICTGTPTYAAAKTLAVRLGVTSEQ